MHLPLSSPCSSVHNLAFVALSFVLIRSSFHISLEERTVGACLRWDWRSALRARFLFAGNVVDDVDGGGVGLVSLSLPYFRFLLSFEYLSAFLDAMVEYAWFATAGRDCGYRRYYDGVQSR